MELEEFYEEVGKLLRVGHQGQPFPYYKRTRWNNRTPGQGRYPGRGTVRVYGSLIHVCLHTPAANRVFDNQNDCLEFLKTLDLV